jgi:hypothetical protein
MRATPAVMVARLIHQEWGDVHDVAENTLAKQLKRLHTAITNGAFGGELAEQARLQASVRIKLFHASTLDCHDEMNQLSTIQRDRVLWLLEKERVSGKRIAALERVMTSYGNLLMDIQKIRFDLGLDEYKRGIPVNPSASRSIWPDDITTQKQVQEAYRTVQEIFEKRRNPQCTKAFPP